MKVNVAGGVVGRVDDSAIGDGVGIKAVLLLVAVTLRVCPVSPGPALIPDRLTGLQRAVFSGIVRLEGDRVERGLPG